MTATMQANWPPIPAWQISQLQQLDAQGKLYGVPPQVLAIISQVESGGEQAGAGVNSAGYGGYFGLGTGQYPGGSVTNAQLNENSPSSFDAQAQVAASAFASYLQQSGGNVVQAEQIYQTGQAGGAPSDGAQIMSQYFGGVTVPTAQLTSAQTSGSSPSCKPIIKTPGLIGSVGSFTLLDSCQAQEVVGVLLMASGGLILFAGLALVAASMGTGRAIPSPARMLSARSNRKTRVAVERERGEQRRAGAEERSTRGRAYSSKGRVYDPDNPDNPF